MAKYKRKAEKRIEKRIKAYEETCKRRSDNGKGFHKPSSNKK